MKKLFSLILVLTFLFVCTSCNPKSSTTEHKTDDLKTVDLKKEQFEAGQLAYLRLIEASELCADVMDSIYGAWYFAIYEADDYTADYARFDAFEIKTGFEYDDIMDAFRSFGLDYNDSFYLMEFNYSVRIAKKVLSNMGKYDEIRNKLIEAKDNLKQMTNEYEEYTNYSNLKKFYSEVSSYFEFAESPSGAFSQLRETIDKYETNIRTYKNDLSFIYE